MVESDRWDPGCRGADRHDHPDLVRTWREFVLLDDAFGEVLNWADRWKLRGPTKPER